MANYDYYKEVQWSVEDYIKENYTREQVKQALKENRFEFEEKLNDELWAADSVTGNGSGSFTFSTYEAEENLAHNWDLFGYACADFGTDEGEAVRHGAEWCDVMLRCYVLGSAISSALDGMEADFELDDDDENKEEEEGSGND